MWSDGESRRHLIETTGPDMPTSLTRPLGSASPVHNGHALQLSRTQSSKLWPIQYGSAVDLTSISRKNHNRTPKPRMRRPLFLVVSASSSPPSRAYGKRHSSPSQRHNLLDLHSRGGAEARFGAEEKREGGGANRLSTALNHQTENLEAALPSGDLGFLPTAFEPPPTTCVPLGLR